MVDTNLALMQQMTAVQKKPRDPEKERMARMRDRRMFLLQEGIKSGEPKISTKVLLQRKGLVKYYHMFRDLGYDLIEMYTLKGDAECEEMIYQVERKYKVKIPAKDRVALWKVFRYRHFDAPISQKRYISSSEVPKLLLTKKDHRTRDTEIDFALLDSDRQRQVIRKYIYDVKEGRKIHQLDIYERHMDIVYNLKDLQRSIKEWQNRDPRFMNREDAREEVFMLRIRKLEEQVTIRMTKERLSEEKKKKLLFQLMLLRLFLFLLAFGSLFMGLSYAQKMPSALVFYFFFGSDKGQKMFVSGVSFFMGGVFCLGLQKKRSTALLRNRLVRMHSVCKKLHNYLVSFRFATNDQRVDKMITELDEMVKDFTLLDDIDWSMYKKQKSNFVSWFASKCVRPIDPEMVEADVLESYDRLPRQTGLPPPADGDRLAIKIGKLRDKANPHKRGREVRRGCNTNTSELLSSYYDQEKNLRNIAEHEDRISRREDRYQSLLDEGFGDSDISSADLWTTSSEGSDDDKDTLDLEEEEYKRFGKLPPRSFTPPGVEVIAEVEESSTSTITSISSGTSPYGAKTSLSAAATHTAAQQMAMRVEVTRATAEGTGNIGQRVQRGASRARSSDERESSISASRAQSGGISQRPASREGGSNNQTGSGDGSGAGTAPFRAGAPGPSGSAPSKKD